MRPHVLLAVAVLLGSPAVALAQDGDNAIQRFPPREAIPAPASPAPPDSDTRSAVPRVDPPERTAEPRQPQPSPGAANDSSRDESEPSRPRAEPRWPSRDLPEPGSNVTSERRAVRRPPARAQARPPSDEGAAPRPGAGIVTAPSYWNHDYPRSVYPYGYGAFGLGYFYYDPYTWWFARPSLYAYGRGFYGRTYGFAIETGKLQLKVAPRDAQVYVDGYFAGTVDDYDGMLQALKLEAGQYHITLVRPGYQPLDFDVLIVPGQKITYSGELRAEP